MIKIKYILFAAVAMVSLAFVKHGDHVNYKCMIQMKNYSGERAYVVVALINPNGEYEKTLYIQGDDEEWYPDIKNWWSFKEAKNANIDGISGATIGNGERNIISLNLEKEYIDAGYKLIFESAVENQEYYSVDAEVLLNSETLSSKVEGKGYIRYVRIAAN